MEYDDFSTATRRDNVQVVDASTVSFCFWDRQTNAVEWKKKESLKVAEILFGPWTGDKTEAGQQKSTVVRTITWRCARL